MSGRSLQPSRGKPPKWVVATVAILALGVFPLDYILLRGEEVARASVALSEDETDTLTIEDVGVRHLLEIRTRRRQGPDGRRIAYRVVAPSGDVVIEEKELTTKKRRYVRFTPSEPGVYLFEADDRGLFETSARASVRVTINDRRLIQWIPWY